MLPQDLDRWYVRNSANLMTPFSAFATAHWTYGSPKLERYNGTASLEFLGAPAPGKSTGDAMKAMEAAAATLPKGIGYEWTGLSYEERLSGSQAPALYAVSLVIVFLCLAALYESWSIPVAVMLVVPLGIIGTVLRDTAARPEQRRLLPGRPADHRRACGQERHPDRGVRQGELRPGHAA